MTQAMISRRSYPVILLGLVACLACYALLWGNSGVVKSESNSDLLLQVEAVMDKMRGGRKNVRGEVDYGGEAGPLGLVAEHRLDIVEELLIPPQAETVKKPTRLEREHMDEVVNGLSLDVIDDNFELRAPPPIPRIKKSLKVGGGEFTQISDGKQAEIEEEPIEPRFRIKTGEPIKSGELIEPREAELYADYTAPMHPHIIEHEDLDLGVTEKEKPAETIGIGLDEVVMRGTEEVVMRGAEEVVMRGTEEVVMRGTEEVVMRGTEEVPWSTIASFGPKKVPTNMDDVKGDAVLAITINGREEEPMIIELFTEQLPTTAHHFLSLCQGTFNKQGQFLKYGATPFHRVIPGFMAQGGRIDVTGDSSPLGAKWSDEGFPFNHDMRGLLSMANSGPNTNGSQFFITFAPTPHLDNHHVVFGRVIKGNGTLEAMEHSGDRRDPLDFPDDAIVLERCSTL